MAKKLLSKQEIRKKFTSIRRAIANTQTKRSAEMVKVTFEKHFSLIKGEAVFGYYPINHELDILPLLKELKKQGGDIYLPHVTCDTKPLQFKEWSCETPLKKARYGVWEPDVATVTSVKPCYVLVPMLAFNKRGFRLGYGGGYYDRTIAQLRKKNAITVIGVAYQCQECDNLPIEAHDERVDWILTEENIYKIG